MVTVIIYYTSLCIQFVTLLSKQTQKFSAEIKVEDTAGTFLNLYSVEIIICHNVC